MEEGHSENTSGGRSTFPGHPQRVVGSRTGPRPGGLGPLAWRRASGDPAGPGSRAWEKSPIDTRGGRQGCRQRGPVSSVWEHEAATSGHEIVSSVPPAGMVWPGWPREPRLRWLPLPHPEFVRSVAQGGGAPATPGPPRGLMEGLWLMLLHHSRG